MDLFSQQPHQFAPKYSLYGIIAHSGSGPHSGHYTAFIKAPNGKWHEMNDEDVGYGTTSPPLDMKEAYILFYVQESDTQLRRAVGMAGLPGHSKFKKRRIESDSEEEEGPARPADLAPAPPLAFAEAAAREQEKIAMASKSLSLRISALDAAKKASAASPVTSTVNATAQPKKPKAGLVDYAGDGEDEDLGEPVAYAEPAPSSSPSSSKPFIGPTMPSERQPASAAPLAPSGPSLLAKSVGGLNIMEAVPSASFYGAAAARKRMSSPGSETESSSRSQPGKKKKSFKHPRDLYSKLGQNNLHERRETDEQQRRDLYGGVEPDRYVPKGGVKNKMKPKPRKPLF